MMEIKLNDIRRNENFIFKKYKVLTQSIFISLFIYYLINIMKFKLNFNYFFLK